MLESEDWRDDDHRALWCPFYRTDGDADNRWTEDSLFTRESVCIGRRCACWVEIVNPGGSFGDGGRCGLAR